MDTPDPNLVVETLREIIRWWGSTEEGDSVDIPEEARRALPHAEAIAEELPRLRAALKAFDPEA
jgi:hypothetical protein